MPLKNQKSVAPYAKKAVFVAALIFILWQVSAVKTTLEYVAISISKFTWGKGKNIEAQTSFLGAIFENKKKLSEENKKLHDALQTAYIKTVMYDDLKRENEEIKELLGRRDRAHGILGVVLSKPNYSPYDVLFIDIGKEQGITPGALVAYQNILLGKIDTVYSRASKVQLFSSPGTDLHVVLSRTRTPAIAYGLGGGTFEMKIPRDVRIEEGDVITYPAIESFVVGVVARVLSKPASPLQTIHFRSPINIFNVQFVVVMPDALYSPEAGEEP